MKKLLCVLMMCCMLAGLSACGTEQRPKVTTEAVKEEVQNETTQANTREEDPSEEVTEATTEAAKEADSGVVTPEFKEMMDSYEAFFDEYIEFMQKYSKADANDMVAMMADYTSYLKSYTEMMDKMNDVNEDELSTADKLYYIDVTGRINQKLLKVEVTQ